MTGWGGARPRTGPKRKPLREHRRNRLMLNLTDDELRLLRSTAGEQSASDYARDVLLKHLRRRRS
jgi:hypothetical protein